MDPHDPAYVPQPDPAKGVDPVYFRLVAYVLSTLLAMIPLSWSSWVTYDAATQMLQVSVGGLAAAIVGGGAIAFGVFKSWGRSR